jgi:hypothetical protein
MRKLLTVMALFILAGTQIFAQDVVLEGNITSDMTLTADNTYLLRGKVRVLDGATLTIEPGTYIFGENSTQGSLIIRQGGKIHAQGTASQPIVFTSEFSKAGSGTEPTYGDWGGIILLGKAPINVPGGTGQIEGTGDPNDIFGGTDEGDDSGVMSYVRIEYPGIAFSPNNEINGLTFGGVGSGTQIDHIQVSYSGDDSYEWFGGSVNCKYMIAFRGWDDDFDTDFGYHGKLQFLVGLRDPEIADVSGSNGFESDNDGSGSLNNPRTSPIWWNVSLYGPLKTVSTVINSQFKRGMHLRRSSKNRISNTLIAGWPKGVLIDGQYTIMAAMQDSMWLDNCVVSGWTDDDLDTVSAAGQNFDIESWFSNNSGRTFTDNSSLMVNDPFNLDAPDFIPEGGSPLLTGAATPPNDGFYDNTAEYVGAFGSADWTAPWARWMLGSYYTAVKDEKGNVISDFQLKQNYPNPFNPTTTISYALPDAGNVKITVSNILGQQVAVVVNKFQNAGTYNVNFDASKLSSGVYMYRLEANNIVISKKMMLMK